MRSVIIAAGLALALCVAPATAQTQPSAPSAPQAHRAPDLEAQRAAMARLAPLLGRWVGEANVSAPHPMTVRQTEQIESAMGGLLLVIRGAGYATADHADAPAFEAMAVASYDDRQGLYEFRSYTRGYATTAIGAFQEDGTFRWSINAGGPVRVRYTIAFTESTWREIGEMSTDAGATWRQTIEMNLRRP